MKLALNSQGFSQYIVSRNGSVFISACYNSFLVYCRELAPGTVSLTGDRAQGDDSKHDSYNTGDFCHLLITFADSLDPDQA